MFFDVYNKLGPGLTENIYRNALLEELKMSGLKYASEKEIPVYYGDKKVGKQRVDILVEDKIILELKALPFIHQRFKSQILSYLKASKLKLGLLVNFGDKKIEIKRYIS